MERTRPAASASSSKREKAYEGKYVIQTEEPQLTPVDAVTIYKDLSEAERAFADLKDVIEMRPISRERHDLPGLQSGKAGRCPLLRRLRALSLSGRLDPEEAYGAGIQYGIALPTR